MPLFIPSRSIVTVEGRPDAPLPQKNDAASDPPRAYSIAQIADRVGLCRATIHRHLANGDLPARKIGRRTVILEADLRAWLETLPAWRPAIRRLPK